MNPLFERNAKAEAEGRTCARCTVTDLTRQPEVVEVRFRRHTPTGPGPEIVYYLCAVCGEHAISTVLARFRIYASKKRSHHSRRLRANPMDDVIYECLDDAEDPLHYRQPGS